VNTHRLDDALHLGDLLGELLLTGVGKHQEHGLVPAHGVVTLQLGASYTLQLAAWFFLRVTVSHNGYAVIYAGYSKGSKAVQFTLYVNRLRMA
jgi:hypothetical protein